jgi:hypothetical protein
MSARYWYDPSIQPFAEDGQAAAARHDDDEALDDWLASMNVGQFEGMLNFLMDSIGRSSPVLDRPVA